MLPCMSVLLARGGVPLLDILLSSILAKFRTFVTWEFACQNLLWLSVFCGLGQAFNLSATSLPKRSTSRLPPHKPFVAESLVPVLTCFGTEPWCGSPFVMGGGFGLIPKWPPVRTAARDGLRASVSCPLRPDLPTALPEAGAA